ncbi:MAG TPA: ABC transporter ATP-binding protein [Geobacteraceae bacterium]|nr:ABC transporter ATP-binding protein [Geobacteraceae bacterium]
MTSLLEVSDLYKSFGTKAAKVEVLKGINLKVAAGETIALVGASGAGKSTLLHVIGTLDRPTSGRVLFGNEDVLQMGDKELARFRNRSIGFVFQFHHLLPEFSALENTMMPLLISGMKKDEAEKGAVGLLADVGLAHRLTHKPGELSGGEQQRVAIARALVMSPRLLLADEPTGNLDMKSSDEIHDILAGINREKGITLIIVTHNERLAARMGKTIRMVDGRIE